MQAVSAAFAANSSALSQYVDYGVQVAWTEQINAAYGFFTIGTSTIAGPDIIKGAGNEVTFLDRYQYSDYSDYCLSLDISRDIGQYPYGTVMAQCEVKLDNTSFKFMPGYDPVIGNYILPNRPLKLSTGFSGETINMFSGYSTTPVNNVNDRELVLSGYDGMNYLNLTPSTGAGPIAAAHNGVYINQYAHVIIGDLLQEAGFATTSFVLEQSLQQPISYFSPVNFQGGTNVQGNQGSIGYIIAALCEAEMGIFFFDETGVAHFWNRQHIPDNTTVQQSFDYSDIINYAITSTPVMNDVIVRAMPRAVQPKQQVWTSGSAVLVPANSSVAYGVDFTDRFGSLPVTSLDTPLSGSYAGDSYYLANLNADGSSTANVSSSLTVTAVALSGSHCDITFSNSGSQPIYVTQLVLFGTPASVTEVIDQEFKDRSSIALYGINPANNGQPITITNDLIQSADTAHSIAYQLVTDYAKPLQRLSLEVMAVPQLQFGDFVNVTLNDTRQTLPYTIVGNTFSQTHDDPFRQTLAVEVKQMVSYFTIGTSAIGGTDSIAP